MAKLGQAAPWITYYNEMRELFKGDEGVKIIYDEENQNINIYVAKQEKAIALEHFLASEKEFGNITLHINIIPPNSNTLFKTSCTPSIRDAFEGNFCVDDIIELEGMFSAVYVVFKKEVVQYFDDNLGDINGNISTLYQNIANNVFEDHAGIFFCTNDRVYSSYVVEQGNIF